MSTKANFTPGPWEMDGDQLQNSEGCAIGTVYGADDFPCLDPDEMTDEGIQCETNARLICNSPDLYEKALALLESLGGSAYEVGLAAQELRDVTNRVALQAA